MGDPAPRVVGVTRVSRLDIVVGDDPSRERASCLEPIERGSMRPRVRVLREDLLALYAPSPQDVASWPVLPDGGVVAEIRDHPVPARRA